MAGPLRPRHLLLGLALLATLAASVWVGERQPKDESAPALPARSERAAPSSTSSDSPASPAAPAKPADAAAPQLGTPQPRPASEGEIVNLFAKQSWFVPPPPSPPSAPPLPYTYLGKYIDGKETVVFLSTADQNLVVRKGDVLDGNYRIDDIAPPTMTITYLPLNQKQTLEIGRAK